MLSTYPAPRYYFSPRCGHRQHKTRCISPLMPIPVYGGLTGVHITCDNSFFYCLTILTPSVVWHIMRYESEPLASYRWLRNRPYTIISSYKFSLCHPISLFDPFMAPFPSYYWVRYWYHHNKNLLDTSIRSTPVHSSHMGWLDLFQTKISCSLSFSGM